MSNYQSTIQLNQGQSISFKFKKPSIMSQLADTLSEQGIDAQVVKKIKICKGRDA
ncbi:hypothetical protein [Amphibacillus indicireducens]|uniref:Uncharacterized protein n=1 Tax=Amphibacillus indicireducens TaxID=1076330 RepID=A0ABP7VEC1_9BACI